MRKRVISFLICLNILISMLPVQSFATEDITEPTEAVTETESLEETTEPTETVTEPTEEVTVPTEVVVETTVAVTEPESTTEPELVCTGLVDCPVSDHNDGCEKKVADEKNEADQNAVDAVAAMINVLPSLDEIKGKELEKQAEDYNQIQTAYSAYKNLTESQKSLIPNAEEVFNPYFDYFNSLITPTDTDDTCGENLMWMLNEGTLTISGSGNMYHYSDSARPPWYDSRKSVTCVILSAGVTNIGNYAFADCVNLKKVYFRGVDAPAIAEDGQVFSGVTATAYYPTDSKSWFPEIMKNYGGQITWKLQGQNLDNCLAAGDYSQASSTYYWTLDYEGTLTLKSTYAFQSYDQAPWYPYRNYVKKVVITYKADYIGSELFFGYENLSEVVIDSTYQFTIGEGAFSFCPSLKTVQTYSCIASIGKSAFEGCSALETVLFNGCVHEIGKWAFSSCKAIKSIYIPYVEQYKGVVIGDEAFAYCDALAEISLPSYCTLGSKLFAYCDGLSVIYINSCSESDQFSVSSDTFSGVSAEVLYPWATSRYDFGKHSADGQYGGNITWKASYSGTCGATGRWRYDPSMKKLTISGVGSLGETYGGGNDFPWIGFWEEMTTICVEDGITTLPCYAFEYQENVKNISLPETLTTLYLNTFNDCKALNNLMIPGSVKEIDTNYGYGFLRCDSLSDLYYMGTEEEWTLVKDSSLVKNDKIDMRTHFLELVAGTATCTEPGTQPYYCFDDTSVYPEKYDMNREVITVLETVNPLGHTEVTVAAVAATCTEDGLTEGKHCSLCEKVILAQETIPASGHTEVIDAEVAATCTKDGLTEGKHCSVCGTVTIPQKVISSGGSHSFVGSTCEYCGIIGGMCGDTAIWTFDGNMKTLTISGTGAVTSTPWKNGYSTAYALVIEDGITELCDHAFRDMPKLSSVQLPSGLTEIPMYCFASDVNLTSVNIPETVTSIGEWAFAGTGFSTFVIPDSVTSDVHDIVSGSNLTELYIGAGSKIDTKNWNDLDRLPSLQKYVVSAENLDLASQDGILYTKDMKTLIKYPDGRAGVFYIPEGVETINSWAFYGSSLVTEIYIPASVKVITENDFAFLQLWEAFSLQNIHVDENNTVFSSEDGVLYNKGKTILYRCGQGKEGTVRIPDGVWEIDAYAFLRCTKLSNVEIPDSMEYIGFGAFRKCSSLRNIVIPASVTDWGQFAFQECSSLAWMACGIKNGYFYQDFDGCYSLKDVYYYGTEADWNTNTISNYDAYVKNATKHYNAALPGTWTIAYVLNGGINSTDNPATYYNYDNDVTLGDPVKKGYLFDGWYLDDQLTQEASAPQLVRGYSSEEKQFYAKWSIDPETHVHQFNSDSLCECGDIGGNCGENLTWALSDGVLTISGTGSMYNYEEDAPWYLYRYSITSLVVENGVTAIGEDAFRQCINVVSVTIPDSVTVIKRCAFYGCTSLTDVRIPNTITTIREAAFYDCTSLTSITIPANVSMIGESAFAECTNLTGIRVEESNSFYSSDSNGVLYNKDKSILIQAPGALSGTYEIPDSVSAIGWCSFLRCKKLTNLIIPDSVKSIEFNAFRDSGLTSVVFQGDAPAETDTIFKELSATVYYPVRNTTWTPDVMKSCGGDITWKPYGNPPAKLILKSLDPMQMMGRKTNISLYTVPSDATVDMVYSMSDSSILEIVDYDDFSCSVMAHNPGTVTVTATDKLSGLSTTLELTLESPAEIISTPYEDQISIDDSLVEKYYSFTPTETGKYLFSATASKAPYSAASNIRVLNKESWIISSEFVSTEDIFQVSAELEAGETYPIWIQYNGIPEGTIAIFRVETLGDPAEVTGVRIKSPDAIECEISPFVKPYYSSICLETELLPAGSTGTITWEISDRNVIDFDESNNTGSFIPKSCGTATITATCNGYSDSVTITVKEPQEFVLNQWKEVTHDKGNTTHIFKFTPPKTGEYVMTMDSNDTYYPQDMLSIITEEDTYAQCPEFGYGVDTQKWYMNLEAGETYYLQMGIGSYSYWSNVPAYKLMIKESSGKPTAMHLRLLNQGIDNSEISFGTYFTPANSHEEIVKVEVNDESILQLVPYWNWNTYHKCRFNVVGEGKVTVTATSESGLTASYTLYVCDEDACKSGHAYGENRECIRCGTFGGTCGADLIWTLSEGVLTISGNGDMYDHIKSTDMPWYDFKDQIIAVEVQPGVTSLGTYAFESCTNLKQISLPDSITRIGTSAFLECSSLESIVIPDSVSEIPYGLFIECSKLEEVTLPDGITSIGEIAFANCTSLSQIDLPSSLINIGVAAFTQCSGLKEIRFHGDVPNIADDSFFDVTATAYYHSTNTSWTDSVIKNYGGVIVWKTYCYDDHSFGEWLTEGNTSSRTCTICGYTEHKVTTDSGDVEIEIPEQPDLDVDVDPVLPSEDNYMLVEKALNNAGDQEQAILKVFDINLKNSDGVHVQPSGTVKVKLPLDWSKNGNYKVYRVNNDGTLTDMNAYRQGSHMVFETDHFSLYVIVEEGHQHDYQNVVTAPNCTEAGFTTYTCDCGSTYVGDEVDATGHSYKDGKCENCGEAQPGVTVSGTVTSYNNNTDTVTIELYAEGETTAARTITVIGNSAEYPMFNVIEGTYTMKVSKNNHVTREYTVTVGTEAVKQDVEICLIGDVNANGRIDLRDYAMVLKHVQKTALITDAYIMDIANVNQNNRIDLQDYAKILKHVQKTDLLF